MGGYRPTPNIRLRDLPPVTYSLNIKVVCHMRYMDLTGKLGWNTLEFLHFKMHLSYWDIVLKLFPLVFYYTQYLMSVLHYVSFGSHPVIISGCTPLCFFWITPCDYFWVYSTMFLLDHTLWLFLGALQCVSFGSDPVIICDCSPLCLTWITPCDYFWLHSTVFHMDHTLWLFLTVLHCVSHGSHPVSIFLTVLHCVSHGSHPVIISDCTPLCFTWIRPCDYFWLYSTVFHMDQTLWLFLTVLHCVSHGSDPVIISDSTVPYDYFWKQEMMRRWIIIHWVHIQPYWASRHCSKRDWRKTGRGWSCN